MGAHMHSFYCDLFLTAKQDFLTDNETFSSSFPFDVFLRALIDQCIFLVAKELSLFIFGEEKTRLRYVAARFVMQNSNLPRLNKILKKSANSAPAVKFITRNFIGWKKLSCPIGWINDICQLVKISLCVLVISGHSHIFHFFCLRINTIVINQTCLS